MNLFLDYQIKIFKFLKKLEKKNIIIIPKEVKKIVVELPPPNHLADISCNAAMVLSKHNNLQPNVLAEKIKSHLLFTFKDIFLPLID